jgi:hypothetical protein
VVDGSAEVEIRGDTGTLRDLSGQPPQWRRLECTGPIPANAVDFRFRGIDGRGRQELVRDPRNGGSAVVRIEDKEGGAEGYTFEMTWGGGLPGGPSVGGYPDRDRGGYPDRGYERGGYQGGVPAGGVARRFTAEQAVNICQSSVREQGWQRFHSRDMYFRDTRMDDNPGRNDWVVGFFDVRPNEGGERRYRFSCSVDFSTGRVRSVDMDPVGGSAPGWRPSSGSNAVSLENCQRAVENRIRDNGFARVEFNSLKVDDNPGRNDWVVGSARGIGRSGSAAFEFSCSVNLNNGNVRSVDLNRR